MSKPRILLVYTGGTIGMGINERTGALEPLRFSHFLQAMPEMALLGVEVDVIQFDPPIDSCEMDPKLWAHLAGIIGENYDRYDGFVVLHGTDTMAYTASALSFMLRHLTKPVILTGSQLPIGMLRTDGKENVITGIELAALKNAEGRAVVPEVCIYFNGSLLRGNRSTKINADGFEAFDSLNYPHLCDAGVEFTFHTHHIFTPDWDKPLEVNPEMDPNVLVFSLIPGIQPSLVDHLLGIPHLRGIVMRTYGSGNAPHLEWMERLLDRAARRNIVIVNVSQCLRGSVQMERYEAGLHLMNKGVISGLDCTVEAAATKLMHLSALYPNDVEQVRTHMTRSLAGELTEKCP